MADINIAPARGVQDISSARDLFQTYADWLARDHDISLKFQGIDAELAGLPGKYAKPDGEILLARNAVGKAVGVIALRRFDARTCEVKRLFVHQDARGQDLGRRLIEAILLVARHAGYDKAVLDTASFMAAAHRLYEAFGFSDIPAYYHNPVAGVRYMGADL